MDFRPKKLNPLDLILAETAGQRWSLVYLGAQPIALAHTQWINGRRERLYPRGDVFPMAYAVAQAADESFRLNRSLPAQIRLTIDLSLHEPLQKAVERYARTHPFYSANDPLSTRRLAVTLLDAFSGDVIALPVWPYASPSASDFDEDVRRLPAREQELMVKNHNLVNHNVGSTIKPLVFASVASQLWPEVDLARLIVFNNAPDPIGEDVVPKPTHPHTRLAELPLTSFWDCQSSRSPITAEEFLVHSVNFYEATVGMIGMWLSKQDKKTSWVEGEPATLSYSGRRYRLDLTRVAESPFGLNDPVPQPRTEQMKHTLLFQGLEALFEVDTSGARSQVFERSARGFIPSLSLNVLDAQGNLRVDALQQVVPEPVIFHPQRFRDVRDDVISFLLGGGACQWSNVRMAEAAARLATGRRVVVHLEQSRANSVAASDASSLPAPLGNAQWRFQNLVEPLRKVSEEGTAESLQGEVEPPYTAIYKTGTLGSGNGRESEYMLFVIGELRNKEFVKGKTVAGFLWMEHSKLERGEGADAQMKKFNLAKLILPIVVNYLDSRSASVAPKTN